MAELIERDGVSVIITEKEIGLNDLEKSIKITQASIDNIDYNMKGMQQRREKLVEKLDQFNAIKDSLPTEPAPATTASPESPA